jgi:hypothetical protein
LTARRPLADLAQRDARKDRHRDQPPPGDLVVAHDRIAVVSRLAWPTQTGEDRVRGHRAVQHTARRVELLSFLGEDREARVHRLHDVVGTDREAVVRGIAPLRLAVRTFEANTKSLEARDERGGRLRARCGLLDIGRLWQGDGDSRQ